MRKPFKNLYPRMIAEFIGTFSMIFAGCGSIMVHGMHQDILPASAIPIVFGLVVASMIYAVGHISGAHFNPAVTLAFTVVKRFSWKELPFYWLSQFLGAILAIWLLYITLPEINNYGATVPTLSAGKAFLWEMILTFFLMFVIVAVATDSRAVGVMAGAAIGAAVMLDAFVGGTLTGASMNPARSIAPALFAGKLSDLWIYVTAPFLGAMLAAISYETIRCEVKEDKKAGGCC